MVLPAWRLTSVPAPGSECVVATARLPLFQGSRRCSCQRERALGSAFGTSRASTWLTRVGLWRYVVAGEETSAQQAAECGALEGCAALRCSNSGRSRAQRSSTKLQRGSKGHPGPRCTRSGGRPGIGVSRSSSRSRRGMQRINPSVYGCWGAANNAFVGACSTMWPAYITATSSANPATTPRSCVISTTAVPNSSRRSRIRSRICA